MEDELVSSGTWNINQPTNQPQRGLKTFRFSFRYRLAGLKDGWNRTNIVDIASCFGESWRLVCFGYESWFARHSLIAIDLRYAI